MDRRSEEGGQRGEKMTRRFRAPTMKQAVAKLKRAFGPDAVIVDTYRGDGSDGPFVSITGAGYVQPRTQKPEARDDHLPAMGGRVEATAAYKRAAAASVRHAPDPRTSTPLARALGLAAAPEIPPQRGVGVDETLHQAVNTLSVEIREIRGILGSTPTRRKDPGDAPGFISICERLVDVGISASHADELAHRITRAVPAGTVEDEAVLSRLSREISCDLRASQDIIPTDGKRRVLAFVGPTGVGKTTTIAKVAARARLIERVPTALVTVDTFRIGAVDQLARYAEILECPLKVVRRGDDLRTALAELSDYPLVLIDTTGRSPRQQDHIEAMAGFFGDGWGGELVLTVSCSTRERDLFATVDGFSRLGIDHLCITKLDETDAVGAAYSVCRRAGRPLAWLTNGQRVPEDIEEASNDGVAARIVDGLRLRGAGRTIALAS